MSVNNYSIPDAVSFLIAILSASVFYFRYLRDVRNRFPEFLLGSVLLATAAASLINFFIDNIVPAGVPALKVPNAAKHVTLLVSGLYTIGGIVLALMLHFMTQYYKIKNIISDNIPIVYGAVVIASVFFWTPLCIQVPAHPTSEFSGWLSATPWQPQLTYWGDIFIVLWVVAFFYTSRAVWGQPVRQFHPRELRLSRTFVQSAFTAWYGAGFFDMISGLNRLNIVAIIPYCVAAISLSFMFALVFNTARYNQATSHARPIPDLQEAPADEDQSLVRQPVSTRNIFICHSAQDMDLAKTICDEIEAKDIGCWIAPRDILPGTDYAEAIIMGIEKCSVMVLLLTASADESPHVHREVEQAVKKRKRIITLWVENMQLSKAMDYFLGSTHRLNAMDVPAEQMIPELINAIEKLNELLGVNGQGTKKEGRTA